MLVNLNHGTRGEHVRLFTLGVVLVTVIVVLIGLSIAIYNKAFERNTMITVKADRAGLQMNQFADVRLNGALIGQVRSVEQDGEEASIRVALQPEAADELPDNSAVRIIPTTLFGQKFMSFQPPIVPSGRTLHAGDVIPSDRVDTNTELNEVLRNLFPLLRAVDPVDLSSSLNALATALDGRGEQLGDTLVQAGEYLEAIEPSLPTLQEDLQLLAVVAADYDAAAPDLLRTLENLTVTGRTVIDRREQLDVFFSSVGGAASTGTRFLGENEQALIRVGEVTRPMLNLLATYSPQFPCLLEGSARSRDIVDTVFEGDRVKQFVRLGGAQVRSYTADDLPEFGEIGHGPWCAGLPAQSVPHTPRKIRDGATLRPGVGPGQRLPILPIPGLRDLLSLLPADLPLLNNRPAPGWDGRGFGTGLSSGFAGTEGEQMLLNGLLADTSGRTPSSYGSLGSLLYGPVVRGVPGSGAEADAAAQGGQP